MLSSDFVRTARASGLGRVTVLVVYGFRNALLPVLTTLGMVFSFLLGANVLVEKVFAWPGLGSYALEALIASDYAPVQGFVLTMATVYVVLNLAHRRALRGGRSARAARGMSGPVQARALRARRKPGDLRRSLLFLCGFVVVARAWDRCSCPTIRWPATPRSALQAAVARALVRHRPAGARLF